jgi:hypothetical protein
VFDAAVRPVTGLERAPVPPSYGLDLRDKFFEWTVLSWCKRDVDVRRLHILVAEIVDVQDLVEWHDADNFEPRPIEPRDVIPELENRLPLLVVPVVAGPGSSCKWVLASFTAIAASHDIPSSER